jgi:DNA-binding MarR family transcriptional regulator
MDNHIPRFSKLSNDTDIGILLGLAFAEFVDELRADLARRGFDDLGRSYGYVLRVLGDGERSLSELAGLLGMTLPGAGKIVDEMEARGYVERHGDPADRRVKRLLLSPRGRAALRAARAFHARFERRLPDAPVLRAALEAIAGAPAAAPSPRYIRPV